MMRTMNRTMIIAAIVVSVLFPCYYVGSHRK